MRLLTHNLLTCNVKGVVNGFPLKIEAAKVERQETDFNEEFIKNMIPKLDYNVLRNAAKQLDETVDLPEVLTDEMKEDESVLKKLHTALMEVTVIEGNLICPESGRKFPVKNGIPNMLLNEDEV
mmetsp:Transcript_7564/g.8683  ORF Transcript_7564/g.8683 Transcript_7564/m.8683 type:complete len:124 (+) Transcript_7564:99-470(+)